jgi:exonuclease SbcD
MRLLHTSDWHLGRSLENRSRLREQEQFIDELCLLVQDEAIDVVLIAGDVFDSVNPPAFAEQLFYDSLARLVDGGKRQVVVIAGNHDNPERLAAAMPLANSQGITLIGMPTTNICSLNVAKCDQSLQLAALAFPSEARLKQLLTKDHQEEQVREAYDLRIANIFGKMANAFSETTVNVAMTHLFVAGSHETDSERPIQVGGAYTVRPSSLPQNAQYIALGHLHRPQSIGREEFPRIRYAGSPLAYSFSEANQAKSVSIIELHPPIAGKEATFKEVILTSGKPLIRWQAQNGLQEVYSWLDEKRDANAWIDLEIYLDDILTHEQLANIRNSHQGLLNIRPVFTKQETIARHERIANQPIDMIFKDFYARQMDGAQPTEDVVQLFLEILDEANNEHEDKQGGSTDATDTSND